MAKFGGCAQCRASQGPAFDRSELAIPISSSQCAHDIFPIAPQRASCAPCGPWQLRASCPTRKAQGRPFAKPASFDPLPAQQVPHAAPELLPLFARQAQSQRPRTVSRRYGPFRADSAARSLAFSTPCARCIERRRTAIDPRRPRHERCAGTGFPLRGVAAAAAPQICLHSRLPFARVRPSHLQRWCRLLAAAQPGLASGARRHGAASPCEWSTRRAEAPRPIGVPLASTPVVHPRGCTLDDCGSRTGTPRAKRRRATSADTALPSPWDW